MGLDRDINYVFKIGDRSVDLTAAKGYIGGSPVDFDALGKITGQVTQDSFVGVAYHSSAEDIGGTLPTEGFGLGTVIFPPAILKLIQLPTDATSPWKTSETYNLGALLRPTTETVDGVDYAVWCPTAYAGIGAGNMVVWPAKVIAREGAAGTPTSLQIVLGAFVETL